MKQFLKLATVAALAATPFFALAADASRGLAGVIQNFGNVINVATPVAVALALLAFFWGLAMYVMSFNGDDKEKKKGRDMMVYGILVLFVMVSVWGIIQILQQTIIPSGTDTGPIRVPGVLQTPAVGATHPN